MFNYMKPGNFSLRRLLILVYIIAIHLAVGFLVYRELVNGNYISVATPQVGDPVDPSPVPTPMPVPTLLADIPSPVVTPTDDPSVTPAELELTIPVQGVKAEQLVDTFASGRSEGRSHDAIDIVAPEGTAVIAAAPGVIARFFDSVPGGTTIYQFTSDRRYVLYYAHLQKRAEGLKPGDPVSRGQLLGYVGDTGNAGKGNFHLHFSVAAVRDPGRYWEGDYLNPFPLLRGPKR